MGNKRFIAKVLGGPIQGHFFDAYIKKKETGRSFGDCLKESVKETFTEDMPGTRHVYQMGKTKGQIEGRVEQAKLDSRKMQKMHDDHENDRKAWRKIDKEKDDLINELGKNL